MVISSTPMADVLLPVLYERMQEEGLLSRVVRGDESFTLFTEGARRWHITVEYIEQYGETYIAGFWWLTPVGESSACFHFCLFRRFRPFAKAIYADIARRLQSAGIINLFFTVGHRDLRFFCVSIGARKIWNINNKEQLWAVSLM
ncbi:hypothetical protein LJC46_04310 [Desulfovibrio sp. OttesenSCG-928-G15]|nr:hypothetical protein [Desulfovibrio sp. OttesenSCG-928-G15]